MYRLLNIKITNDPMLIRWSFHQTREDSTKDTCRDMQERHDLGMGRTKPVME
jgi:hypothetical protein